MNQFKLLAITVFVSMVMASSARSCIAQQPLVEPYLMSGKLSEGRTALENHLESHADDDQARFGLGVLQFMQSVEHLGRSWHLYGINNEFSQLAFFRLPVPNNPNPKRVTYPDVRSVLKEMISYLEDSEKSLAKIKSKDVKLPLHLFQLHFDIDQDGKISPVEDLTEIYAEYFGSDFGNQADKKIEMVVAFDYSDVQWLRGYTHLIRAMCETILAYDQEPLWNMISHYVFLDPSIKYDFVEQEQLKHKKEGTRHHLWQNQNLFLDLIASAHNLNFKITDPERLKRAHNHLKQTITHSREMWKQILAESDDDREWIPNPKQSSMVSPTQITTGMVETWDEFLDEVDALLDGTKLLPFWRGTDKTRGINLHKMFHEPRDLDFILFVHGAGAIPFLENGDVTQPGTWNRFQRAYRGNLFSFAAWFN